MVSIEDVYKWMYYAGLGLVVAVLLIGFLKASMRIYKIIGAIYVVAVMVSVGMLGYTATQLYNGYIPVEKAIYSVLNILMTLVIGVLIVMFMVFDARKCKELFPGDSRAECLCVGLGSRRAADFKQAFPGSKPKERARLYMEMDEALRSQYSRYEAAYRHHSSRRDRY